MKASACVWWKQVYSAGLSEFKVMASFSYQKQESDLRTLLAKRNQRLTALNFICSDVLRWALMYSLYNV